MSEPQGHPAPRKADAAPGHVVLPRILGRLDAGRAAILVTVCLWGAQFPILHELASRWDAYTLIISRYLVAAAIFLAIEQLSRFATPDRHVPFAHKAALGAAISMFAVLFTLGIAIGDPVTSAILSAVAPITASIIAWTVTRERPQSAVIAAMALVVPGAVLASVDLSGAVLRERAATGAVLILCGQAFWSWYSIMAQRWLAGWGQLALTSRSMSWSLPYLAVAYTVALLTGQVYVDYSSSPLYDAGAFLLLTVGALAIGVLFWNVSVSRLGLYLSSIHLNLIPIVAMLVALLQGVVPRVEQLIGAGLVIAGVILAQTRGVRPPPASDAKVP